ncbi:MAG TPA: hypothetical protein VLV48_06385, partial [Thermoanaerobaculia bacterium]|nr:hypothetical protein [Thermoanaerobaculia bacterium]
ALASRARGRIVPLGRERFPTWRVVIGDRAVDVTDIIGSTIDQDLARRDFTINALALPLHGPAALLDPFRGEADIDARRIRMIARENLVDDPLRILKAIRLAATLRFEIEPATLAACAEEAPRLTGIAGERIGAELGMMFEGGDPAIFAPLLRATALDRILFDREAPEWLARVEAGDPVLLWSAIFQEAASEDLRDAARKLRWPSSLAADVAALLRARESVKGSGLDSSRLDPILHDAGERGALRLIALAAASGEGDVATALDARIGSRGEDLFSLQPLLDGDEIREAAGLDAGPLVGRLKRELILEQIAGRVRDKGDAARWVRARAASISR